MKLVGIKQAKAQLSALFTEALKGGIVIISNSNSGEAVRLVPVRGPLPIPAGFGLFADRFKDLPPDYWTNPKYDEAFLSLFTESAEK